MVTADVAFLEMSPVHCRRVWTTTRGGMLEIYREIPFTRQVQVINNLLPFTGPSTRKLNYSVYNGGGGKFLKKLWCCVGVSPSSERIRIYSDEGLTLETSASGGQFTLSTQLIKPNYSVYKLPPFINSPGSDIRHSLVFLVSPMLSLSQNK